MQRKNITRIIIVELIVYILISYAYVRARFIPRPLFNFYALLNINVSFYDKLYIA